MFILIVIWLLHLLVSGNGFFYKNVDKINYLLISKLVFPSNNYRLCNAQNSKNINFE